MNATRHQRAMEIFQEAVEQPPCDRDEFLDQHCGDDLLLRREVESLLAHHDPRSISIEPDFTGLLKRLNLSSATPAPPSSRIHAWFCRANTPRMWFAMAAISLSMMLSVLSWGMYRGVRQRLRANLAGQLEATLGSNIAAVDNWLKLQLREIEGWAEHPLLLRHYSELVELAVPTGTEATVDPVGLRATPPHARLAELVSQTTERSEVVAVSAVHPSGTILFNSSLPKRVLQTLSATGRSRLQKVWQGGSILLPPITEGSFFPASASQSTAPLIVAGSAIKNDRAEVLGGLILSIRASEDFTSLLDLGRAGPRCDTYAFSHSGKLLSESRYEPELRRCGLLDDSPTSSSVLHVMLRDPGVNLITGETASLPAETRPLTKMAAAAAAGVDGIDVDGYRDYRGVLVVGAWQWLEEYGFGVATEIERDQAYAALDYLGKLASGVVFLLAVLGVGAFVAAVAAVRLSSEIDEVRQLGQYSLEKLIGEGGMGRVYLARHAMLRRPTAIKTLNGQFADEQAVRRFEREVQLVSSLQHPNTIEIYDYGRTTDGVFYFVMEFVAGLNLEQLVALDGTVNTPRTLWILRQLLGSLAEAHSRGLIHRDVKPTNIMLCRRGDEADWVKVVDFGLAKDIGGERTAAITQTGVISGTPQYIAPECLEDASLLTPAADVYAVGATAFKLLTGRDLFLGNTMLDIFAQVLHDDAPRASLATPAPIPAELDELIFQCVRRRPEQRPRDAGAVLELLRPMLPKYPWPRAQAEAWWQAYEAKGPQAQRPI